MIFSLSKTAQNKSRAQRLIKKAKEIRPRADLFCFYAMYLFSGSYSPTSVRSIDNNLR